MTHAALAEDALVDNRYPWRRRDLGLLALAIDDEVHWQPGAHQGRFLKRFKAADWISVDRLSPRRRPETRPPPPDCLPPPAQCAPHVQCARRP